MGAVRQISDRLHFLTSMAMKTTTKTNTRERSREWYERAQQSLIEGVNSPSRGAAVYSPGPVVLDRGRGSHVWDLDGNEYVDFMMSFGALIQGHAHPKIVEVVSQTMADGSHFAAATPAEAEAAERFRRMVPSRGGGWAVPIHGGDEHCQ